MQYNQNKIKKKLITPEFVTKVKFIILLITALISIAVIYIYCHSLKCYGTSMKPTINEQDIVIFKKSKYNRGDLLVFEKNHNDYVKRLIGLPGDIVSYDGEIYKVNNKPIPTYNIPPEYLLTYDIEEFNITLNKNEYFVMGDNRNDSIDSRYTSFGLVNSKNIIGKVICVWKD